jgi:ABC-type Zn uptake system ZnuABC Zn-binding protein ZnuA
VLALLVAGCASDNPAKGDKPEAIATTPIVASIVKAVGGSDVNVTTMVPAGADPHEFEPKPSDIAAVAESELIVANGGLDGWIEKVRERSGSDTRVIDLLAGVPIKLAPGHDEPSGGRSSESHGKADPHWFHDPRNAAAAATTVAFALGRLDPVNASAYRSRARAFAGQARRLDAQGRRCIARLPAGQRTLVTDHDAFAYLAARTGLRIVGTVIPSTSSSAAPSASELDSLARRIEDLKIKAIFPETALDPKTAKALAEQTGASAAVQLDADTLGPPGSTRDSWAGMWATNVSAIAKGLSGGRITCSIGPARP